MAAAIVRLDQINVPVVLFDGDLDKDRISINQLAACLVEESRGRGHARKDVVQADILGRIVIGERLKKRAAQKFHIYRGVVLVILDAVDFEKAQG